MSKTTPRSSIVIALGLSLLLPLGSAAQSGAAEDPSEDPTPVPVPSLEGLAWYRSIDTTGAEIEETREASEVDAWALLAERADASLGELEYSFLQAFDPDALPDLGAMATVRVAGAEATALEDAVVQDVVDQIVAAGGEAPEPESAMIAGKDVTVLALSDGLGYDEAVVYATGDVAYVFLMPRDLAERALEQLP